MQKQLQSNKLMQWGVMFLVAGLAVQLAAILSRYAGLAIIAGVIIIVVALIRGK